MRLRMVDHKNMINDATHHVPSPPAAAIALGAGAPERPVFLDETGRRARLVRLTGGLLAAGTLSWLAALVVGASVSVSLPALPNALAATHRVGPATAFARQGYTPLTVRPLSGHRVLVADVDRRPLT